MSVHTKKILKFVSPFRVVGILAMVIVGVLFAPSDTSDGDGVQQKLTVFDGINRVSADTITETTDSACLDVMCNSGSSNGCASTGGPSSSESASGNSASSGTGCGVF